MVNAYYKYAISREYNYNNSTDKFPRKAADGVVAMKKKPFGQCSIKQ